MINSLSLVKNLLNPEVKSDKIPDIELYINAR